MPFGRSRSKTRSLLSWSDGESSRDSLHTLGSPDATTISSQSRRSSIFIGIDSTTSLTLQCESLRVPQQLDSKHAIPEGHKEFVALQQELARFTSKTGPSKTNILRLTLLPFLRQRLFEAPTTSGETAFRLAVLGAWWSRLLTELSSKDHTSVVAGSDRFAYYEAISGILSRSEWLSSPASYAANIAETVSYILLKTSVPNLPIALGAFAGKVLAYGFFFTPGLAATLIYLLRPTQAAVDRLVARSLPPDAAPAIESLKGMFPGHVEDLVGARTVIKRRPAAATKACGDLFGQWKRHWSPATGLFASFLRHYYHLVAKQLPPESGTWLHAHLFAPGLLLIQGSIVHFLDGILHSIASQRRSMSKMAPRKDLDKSTPLPVSPNVSPPYSRRTSATNLAALAGSPQSKKGITPQDLEKLSSLQISRDLPTQQNRDLAAGSGIGPASPNVRVDQLRLFSCLREVLHADQDCLPYYRPFCLQFDNLMQTVASAVSVYEMDACIKLCDLAEEWLSCVTLKDYRSEDQVYNNKAGAANWEFWAHAAGRMMSTENCYSEIRAFSLLFNIWPHIPQCRASDTGHLSEVFPAGKMRSDADPVYDTVFMPKSENVLWDVTEWLLSPLMWPRYFCHWNPLVRSYYHRLLCFRMSSTGRMGFEHGPSRKYHEEARALLKDRLSQTYSLCVSLADNNNSLMVTSASMPVPSRRFAIGYNVAAQQLPQQEMHRVYLFDIFDHSAYYSEEISAQKALSRSNSVKSSVSSVVSSAVSDTDSVYSMSSETPIPSPEESEKKLETSTKPRSLSRRLSLFKKLLPYDQEPDKPPAAATPSPSTSKSSIRRKKSKAKFSTKGTMFGDPSSIPAPWQLKERRPEIQRPVYKFNLVGSKQSQMEQGMIARPRLPFTRDLEPVITAPASRTGDDDLAYWNYGARSLREWNETVVLFEDFLHNCVELEDSFSAPFMVAEIPWRPVF